MFLSSTSLVQQSPECLTADVAEEAVLMSVATGQYVSLAPISKDIWQLIVIPRSVADICDDLAARYDADEAEITSDVLEFLRFMITAGVVRSVD